MSLAANTWKQQLEIRRDCKIIWWLGHESNPLLLSVCLLKWSRRLKKKGKASFTARNYGKVTDIQLVKDTKWFFKKQWIIYLDKTKKISLFSFKQKVEYLKYRVDSWTTWVWTLWVPFCVDLKTKLYYSNTLSVVGWSCRCGVSDTEGCCCCCCCCCC